MRSDRPLARFHPFLLAAFMVAAWAIYAFALALLGGWWQVVPAVLTGIVFGLALGESVFRMMYPPLLPPLTPAISLGPDDPLPPPGFVVVICERCRREGAVPAILANDVTLALCSRCLAETGGR